MNNIQRSIRQSMIDNARQLLKQFGYIIPTLWHRDDVVQRIKDRKGKLFSFTSADVDSIVSILDLKHNAEIGLNWDTIDIAIDEHFNQKKNEDKTGNNH